MNPSKFSLSLRGKLLVLVEVGVILMGIGVSLYFAKQEEKRTLQMIDRRVESLTTSLALQGQLGVLLGDRQELSRSLRSFLHDDVVYAAYADSTGAEIVVLGTPASRVWPVPDHCLIRQSKALSGEYVREAIAPIRSHIRGVERTVGAAVLAVSLRSLAEVRASALKTGLVVTLLFSVLGYLGVTLLSWHIVRPLRKLEEAAKRISSGDRSVEIDIDQGDEIGRLAEAFRKMAADVDRAITELEAQRREAEKLREEAERARRSVESHNQRLQKEVHDLLMLVEQVTDGDLTVRVDLDTKGELGQLAEKIQLMATTLRDILGEIRSVSESLVRAADRIKNSTENMAASASEQTAQITDVVGSVAEIAGTIRETSEFIQTVAGQSQNAKEIAQKGYQYVEDIYRGLEEIVSSQEVVTTTISNLVSQVATIGEIASVIEEIADQTNLLALNAAIEAARAGEHGRGFAVVAEEVGKLAERTTSATREIGQVIKAIQQRTAETDQSVEAARKVASRVTEAAGVMQKAMQEIVKNAETVQEMLSHVAASSQQQSSAVEQVSRNMESIRSAAVDTANGTHEIALESENLSRIAVRLDSLLSQFQLEEHAPRVVEVGGVGQERTVADEAVTSV